MDNKEKPYALYTLDFDSIERLGKMGVNVENLEKNWQLIKQYCTLILESNDLTYLMEKSAVFIGDMETFILDRQNMKFL